MPTVILATSNGTGMGHLARAAATALAAGEMFRPVLFSMSQALPLVRSSLGLTGEYCPSPQRRFMTSVDWHEYLARRIEAVIAETGAQVFAFDGAFPYHGVSLARRRLPDVAFVWVRRGMWKPGANLHALRKRRMFDAVLEPGDLAAEADRGATAAAADVVRVPPVTLLECVDRVPKEQARAELGLDQDRPVALVTLRTQGSDAAMAAVRTILADDSWLVALTRSPISAGDLGLEPHLAQRVVRLHGVFPLARYLSAFDAAVTETGYNSFHEMLYGRMPVVFVPTEAALTDDQAARASWAAGKKLALSAPERDPDRVAGVVTRLLDHDVRAELAGRLAELSAPEGAAAAATTLADVAAGFTAHRFSVPERAEMVRAAVRPAVEKVIGPRAVAGIQRLLGRREERVPPLPGPVTFTESAGTDAVSGTSPVEDLLPRSSAGYRRRREEIARTFYPSG
ncbi:MAG: hypothetical protein DIU77_005460 [Thermocrispum agreste]|uniref:UDP-N-acetylglucosamine--LPS N-acetylglucosamine transferase n=1 Tax=Thermocrispum agreste TaxID=37925 RepID=A0A2W4LDQ4_9PSEU|nr:MAG: hypothetical protein DIU77_06400 [Thermocrispum agreste]